jgi:hypothetical protein
MLTVLKYQYTVLKCRLFGGFNVFNFFTMFLLKRLYKFTGHPVAQLVEALRYNPEGCGFDIRGGR